MALTMNQMLEAACVATVRDNGRAYLEYNGKRIKRPFVADCEGDCLEAFGIVLSECAGALAGYRRELNMCHPGMSNSPCDAEQMALFALEVLPAAQIGKDSHDTAGN